MKKLTLTLLVAITMGAAQNCQAATMMLKKLAMRCATAGSITFGGVAAYNLTSNQESPSILGSLANTIISKLTTPAAPVAAPITMTDVATLMQSMNEQHQANIAALVATLNQQGQRAQPSELNWAYIGPMLTFIGNHKIAAGVFASVTGLIAAYHLHEGTRAVVRERFSALGTALNTLRNQLMERLGNLRQEMHTEFTTVGTALNTMTTDTQARLNVLDHNLRVLAQAVLNREQQAQLQAMPEAQGNVYQPTELAETATPTDNLLAPEQSGYLAKAWGFVSGLFNKA